MKFTFGICWDGKNSLDATKAFYSILDLKIPESDYEVISIGGNQSSEGHKICDFVNGIKIYPGKQIAFDETQKEKGWITRKKNIIAQEAQYENIVFLHDYFTFLPGWYDGWLKFGNDFDIAMNSIATREGLRHSDWTVDPYKVWKEYPQWDWNMWDLNLPYEATGLTKIQYISGGYWIAKKQFMLDNPLDESLCWGEFEDIRWSEKIREKTEFKFNPHSIVQIMKPGKWAPGLLDEKVLETVKKANGL